MTNNSACTRLPSRMMGSETEYTTRMSFTLNSRIDKNLVIHMAESNNLWLKNGARIYEDYGSVIEYATPECRSGAALVLHERIGEIIVKSVADRTLTVEGDGLEGIVTESEPEAYKRTGYADVPSPDSKSSLLTDNLSTGHHENYEMRCPQDHFENVDGHGRHFLLSYLATRPIWSGSGMVTPDGYALSQKAEAIDFNGDSLIEHGSKQPLRLHDDRIEIRTGEGNMSEWAIRTKFDMTSLVLRMIEHETVPKDALLKYSDYTRVMRAVSVDPETPLDLTSSRSRSAAGHQRMIAEHALWFAEKHGAPRHEVNAAIEVHKACQDIDDYFESKDLTGISDRIDWAAKLSKLGSRKLVLGSFTSRNLVAVAHDLSWEDTSLNGPARRWYRNRQSGLLKPADVRRSMHIPPSGRAKQRSEYIRGAGAFIKRVDWDAILMRDGSTLRV